MRRQIVCGGLQYLLRMDTNVTTEKVVLFSYFFGDDDIESNSKQQKQNL